MSLRIFSLVFIALLAISGPSVSSAQSSSAVTFDKGWEGWEGPQGDGGLSTIRPTGGNPGAHAHINFQDFGIDFLTSSHPGFIGDYSEIEQVTISVDVKVESVETGGFPTPRELIVEFRNRALAENDLPWASVWYKLTGIENGMDWATYSVTFDPRSTELPPGWGGYGAEDSEHNPILPEGVTFADVMSNVDEVSFNTLVPGMAYVAARFNIRIDNIRIDVGADETLFEDGFEDDVSIPPIIP